MSMGWVVPDIPISPVMAVVGVVESNACGALLKDAVDRTQVASARA